MRLSAKEIGKEIHVSIVLTTDRDKQMFYHLTDIECCEARCKLQGKQIRRFQHLLAEKVDPLIRDANGIG